MAITAVVGDVHGCSSELEALLEALCFEPGKDRLVFVGDLVARGPDSRGVLAIARRLGARMVRGNHEARLLSWRKQRHHGKPLNPEHARVAAELSREDWAMLDATPLWVDLPEHGLRIVHAGIPPGVAPEDAPADALVKMRTVDSRGRWSDDAEGGVLWGSRYAGPPHVVFGHHARPEPQLHEWATGIDTGCVYGRRLTAVVLAEGEPMPRGESARVVLRSVPALRTYFTGKVSALG